MVFIIQLEHGNFYSGGDFVRGRVVFSTEKDEEIRRVSITFMGRTVTQNIIGRVANDTNGWTTLFSSTKTLHVGKRLFKAGQHSWPFRFQFPLHTMPGKSEDSFDNDEPFLSSNVSHPLPPTFNARDLGFPRDGECFIEYKLEASITKPMESPIPTPFLDTMSHTLDLRYLPFRLVESPDPSIEYSYRSFTAQTLRLLPEKAHAKLTMKEKLRSTFSSYQLPFANFTVEMTYPTQVYPGGPFPLHLALKGLQTSEDVPQEPTIFVKSVSIGVKSLVSFRTMALVDYHKDRITKYTDLVNTGDAVLHVELPQARCKAAEEGFEDSRVDLTKVGGTNFTTRTLDCCDFRTYNVAVENTLKITIDLMCADQQFQFKVKTPLKVLPSVYRRLGDDDLRSFIQELRELPAEEVIAGPSDRSAYDAPPPRYELSMNDELIEQGDMRGRESEPSA